MKNATTSEQIFLSCGGGTGPLQSHVATAVAFGDPIAGSKLRRGQPAYRPELLPSFRLKEGNVLTVNKAAFRAAGQWFDLRFRCEIDADATRVLSFAYEVGKAIPKSEWKGYGFPEF